MSWVVKERGFDPGRITANGNKFMIGNGGLGYRGTLEEFGKRELTATIVAGLYDRVGHKWREPVNAPNGLALALRWDGTPLDVLSGGTAEHIGPAPELLEHEQSLDLRHAVHRRRTTYRTANEAQVTVISERFCSAARPHLIVNRISVESSRDGILTIVTGIDGDVWDINGPHLERLETGSDKDGSGDVLTLTGWTHERNVPVSVAEAVDDGFGEQQEQQLLRGETAIRRTLRLDCRAGTPYAWTKYVSVFTGLDETGEAGDPLLAAIASSREARGLGYDRLLREHAERWERMWDATDIVVEGDEEAQLALRYSMYQLHIIAPDRSEKVSIPARGLSGQVYKGAVFWDTEMFMLPFFLHTRPEVARNLMMYRVHTLDGARRKAAEYGFGGAFYAWESQETGDDACTLFNVNDVFTGRPMRTYFRDKQVHISADVAYGIWQYYTFTGDESLLLDGGAEVAWECAVFYYTYGYFNPRKQRYEILDITGPDEYHERVNNNAFTNRMVKMCLRIALDALDLLRDRDPRRYEALLSGASVGPEQIRDMYDRLYVPEPDGESGLIEQFDGYYALEDVSLADLKSRILNPHEYLGGGERPGDDDANIEAGRRGADAAFVQGQLRPGRQKSQLGLLRTAHRTRLQLEFVHLRAGGGGYRFPGLGVSVFHADGDDRLDRRIQAVRRRPLHRRHASRGERRGLDGRRVGLRGAAVRRRQGDAEAGSAFLLAGPGVPGPPPPRCVPDSRRAGSARNFGGSGQSGAAAG